MKVSLNDFKRQWAAVQTDVLSAVARVGESGWYILGENVAAFETALAASWGLPHAVGVANGLDAIEVALRSLDIKPGDRVLTTPLSAFATTLAIMRMGGTPVFVDTTSGGLIDLDRCRVALSEEKTIRCHLPVHLFGQSLDLDGLKDLRERFDIPLIEDCAQSIGASWKGRPTGTVGDIAATSFYPTKNLGALGDGGALLMRSAALCGRARVLRHYGQREQYVHEEPGLNSRLDELHAAVLAQAMLPRLPRWTERRREVASRFLAGISHKGITLPQIPAASDPCWHLFPVMVDAASREAFMAHLREQGVASGIHYPRLITDQQALKQYGRLEILGDLTNAQRVAREEVSLPIHPFLTDDEITHVISACNNWKESGCSR